MLCRLTSWAQKKERIYAIRGHFEWVLTAVLEAYIAGAGVARSKVSTLITHSVDNFSFNITKQCKWILKT